MKANSFAPRSEADNSWNALGFLCKKKKVEADEWETSTIVHKALRYETYPYLGHVNSAYTNSTLYTTLTNLSMVVTYNHQSPRLLRVFGWQPEKYAAVLGIPKPKPTER